jgi:hypothetical protein
MATPNHDLHIEDKDQPNRETGVNPKEVQGVKKPPLHLIPPVAEIQMAMALKNGAEKYGPFNWRETNINLSTYIGAIKRHIASFADGENYATDSNVHHLAHIMACCAIALDSISLDLAEDDRPSPGKASEMIELFTTDRSLGVQKNTGEEKKTQIIQRIKL